MHNVTFLDWCKYISQLCAVAWCYLLRAIIFLSAKLLPSNNKDGKQKISLSNTDSVFIFISDSSIEAPPSFTPPKKYSDISGLPVSESQEIDNIGNVIQWHLSYG